MRKSLTKRERLKKKSDFNRVFSNSSKTNKFSQQGIAIRFCRNDLTFNRIGIIVTKKCGNAVKRNKEKRRIRELYRRMKHDIRKGYDIIVVIYTGGSSYEKRREQLHTLFRRSNLLGSME